MARIVVVQHICTHWTKAARGGEMREQIRYALEQGANANVDLFHDGNTLRVFSTLAVK